MMPDASPTPRPVRRPRGRWAAAPLLALAAGVVPVLSPSEAEAVTGGQPVQGGDLAFVAELRAAGGLCTGSLVHRSWVLTAQHCSYPTSIGDLSVRVGNVTAGTGGEFRRVSRILRRPGYVGGHDDVALLELSSPVTTVAPVPLANPSQAHLWDGVQGGPFTVFDQGIATGWGRDASGALPTRLQFVGVNITPPRPDDLGIRRVMVDRGPCQGDSGGPLLVQSAGGLVQAGVLKGAACGGAASYSEVGAGGNRDWVLGQVTRLPYTSFGVTDWDRDGHQDIVTRQDATGDLWLYPGESRRGYSATQRVQIGNGWAGYTPVGLADWDRDGHQDVVTRHDATGVLWLYPGESRRGTTTTQRVRIGDGWAGRTSFGVTDWDRDGHQDVVARDDASGDLLVHPGGSLRGPSGAAPVRIGWGWNGYSSFEVTDWDRDGHQDLVARQNDTADLWLYPGESRRGVTTTPRVRIGNGWSGYTSFATADYDRDGHQDVVTRHDASGDLWLYPGESRRGPTTTPRVRIGNGW